VWTGPPADRYRIDCDWAALGDRRVGLSIAWLMLNAVMIATADVPSE
jgi:hypothetical protein